MNKSRRNELQKLKWIKRMKLRGLDVSKGGQHQLKSHSAPCSCWCCRDKKYRNERAAMSEIIRKSVDLPADVVEMVNENFWNLV